MVAEDGERVFLLDSAKKMFRMRGFEWRLKAKKNKGKRDRTSRLFRLSTQLSLTFGMQINV